MKCVQISGAYVGAQKTIERAIHKELVTRRYGSFVFYAVGCADDLGIKCYETKTASFFRRGLRKLFGKTPLFAYWSTCQLIKQLQKYQPDLVHLHTLHQGYLDYSRLFRYLESAGVPVVYTLHDMWPFTGGCYYYTETTCAGFLTGCINCPAQPSKIDNAISKTAYYHRKKREFFDSLASLHFVAVSDWVRTEAKKSFLAKYPITVIENGIDFLDWNVSFDNNTPKRIISVAATWDERKGVKRIFKIAEILGEEYQFDLVGRFSEAIKGSAPSNVHFLGYIESKEKLMELYAKADLHLSASLEETFGMTFIEAASVGTRSVGYDSTAVSSTLKGVYGIISPEKSEKSMANTIRDTLGQKEYKLSEFEREAVKMRYSSKSMAEKYCDLYVDILSDKVGNHGE